MLIRSTSGLKKSIRRACLFLFGLLLVLLIVYLNSRTLSKYDTIASGDFYQLIDPKLNYTRYFYAWINQVGQGTPNPLSISAPFYHIWAAYSQTPLAKTLNFPMLSVLILSYISCFFALRNLAGKTMYLWNTTLALFYCFNYFTISMFSYPWGYTHHYLFYIFVPVLLERFYNLIRNENRLEFRDYGSFILFNALSSIAYNNLGFLFALLMVEFLLALGIVSTGTAKNLKVIKKTVGLFAIQITIHAPYMAYFLFANSQNVSKLITTETFGGGLYGWYIYTSSTFIDSLLLRPINTVINFNPVVLIYSILLILSAYKLVQKRYFLLPALFLLIILLNFVTKVNSPMSWPIEFLLTNTLFAVLRSPDKIFTFMPFLFCLILAKAHELPPRIYKSAVLAVLVTLGWFVYQFMHVHKALKYGNGKYTYLINIPKEYYKIRDVINTPDRTSSILSIPYSVKNSINWSNYPAWGFVGHDILHLLYNKNFISANTFDHPSLETKMSFKEWGEEHTSIQEDLRLLQNFSVEYILWHKDISPDRLMEASSLYRKIRRLNQNNYLVLVENNRYFELYKLSDEYVKPIVTTNNSDVLHVEKINPILYVAKISNFRHEDLIVFNQSYNKGWELIVYPRLHETSLSVNSTENKEKFWQSNSSFIFMLRALLTRPEIEHKMVNNYANGWKLTKDQLSKLTDIETVRTNNQGGSDLYVAIVYKLQVLLYVQYALTIVAIATGTVAIILGKANSRLKSYA